MTIAVASVEQALALDQDGKSLGRAEVPENGDHGDRVGGGDNSAEQQAGNETDIGEDVKRAADREGRDQEADDREHEDRRDVVDEAADIDGKRRFMVAPRSLLVCDRPASCR